ncbi:MAG: hypothetical protein R3C01_12425 [Planctomycetaceae bacterium]
MPFLKALQQTTERSTDPFLHYVIRNSMNEEQIGEINSAMIADVPRVYDGTRAGDQQGVARNANTRCFVDTENVDNFPALGELIDELRSVETIELVEHMLERSLVDCNLRFEVLCDRKGFWLEPHKDIKEKRMSMLLYSNPCGESINLGTDLYDKDLKLVKTMPFETNVGYMFGPGDDTWHGLEKKEIKQERRSLLINYVTFDTCWKLPSRTRKKVA